MLQAAARCLGQAGAEATGAALIEGLVCVAPAACFACCLHVALVSPASEARTSTLGMLCKVPGAMLPPAVVAEALAQVGGAATPGLSDGGFLGAGLNSCSDVPLANTAR